MGNSAVFYLAYSKARSMSTGPGTGALTVSKAHSPRQVLPNWKANCISLFCFNVEEVCITELSYHCQNLLRECFQLITDFKQVKSTTKLGPTDRYLKVESLLRDYKNEPKSQHSLV